MRGLIITLLLFFGGVVYYTSPTRDTMVKGTYDGEVFRGVNSEGDSVIVKQSFPKKGKVFFQYWYESRGDYKEMEIL